MKSSFESDLMKMPEYLRATYQHIDYVLFGGLRPKRSVRLDMMTACLKEFDWIVKLIANSPFCINNLVQSTRDTRKKRMCKLDCERCIRTYVAYKLDKAANAEARKNGEEERKNKV